MIATRSTPSAHVRHAIAAGALAALAAACSVMTPVPADTPVLHVLRDSVPITAASASLTLLNA